MRQAFSRIFARSSALSAPKALMMGTAAATFYMYRQPDLTFMKSQMAMCAPALYKAPS